MNYLKSPTEKVVWFVNFPGERMAIEELLLPHISCWKGQLNDLIVVVLKSLEHI
jgi:hypothetical protein